MEAGRDRPNRVERLFERRRPFRSHGIGRACGFGPPRLGFRRRSIHLPVGLRDRRTAKRPAAPFERFQAQAFPEFPFFLGIGLPGVGTRPGQEHRFIDTHPASADPASAGPLLSLLPSLLLQRPLRRCATAFRSKRLRFDLRGHLIGEAPSRPLFRLRARRKLRFLAASEINPVRQKHEDQNGDDPDAPLCDDAAGQRSRRFGIEPPPADHGPISGAVKRHRTFCLPICTQPSPKT